MTETPADYNFDSKAERFARRIYGGLKGQLRLSALMQDLRCHAPAVFAGNPLEVWDAGGGLGQMTEQLAALGHRVVLNDISEQMLKLAQARLAEQALLDQVDICHQSIQQFAAQGRRFDLVICHAVLEWLADPEEVVGYLLGSLKPGGILSLAFYNRDAAIWMNVLKGNFKKALSGDLAGHPGSLTPTNPQDPEQVLQWVQRDGYQLVHRAGVRVAADYLRPDVKPLRSAEDIETVEQALRCHPSFWRLGRYIHLLVRRVI